MPAERATRLYAILARRSRAAVVFRRGPSKQVMLLRWDRETDTFERGQWLAGRIYERRCDLSPGGDLLVYFAARYKSEPATYTVISRPPYFTALALFPKGDAWGGGGLFEGEHHLRLNHRVHGEMALMSGFSLPKGFVVEPMGERSGWGEDGPIEHARRIRDGWVQVSEGEAHRRKLGAPTWIDVDPPRVYARPHPRAEHIVLQERLRGIKELEGPWYVTDYALVVDGTDAAVIERCDWADWDERGNLLYAKGGRLYRAPVRRRKGELAEAKELIDLRGEEFRRLAPPPGTSRW